MSIASTVLIFSFIGLLGAWRRDIDINRVRLLPKGESRYKYPSKVNNPHSQRSIFPYKNNDNDDHSSGFSELRPEMQFLPNVIPTTTPKAIKVHQPREDPRLFYLSDAYAKKINQKNLNNEVSGVYPGADVVHANDDDYYRYNRVRPARMRERDFNNPSFEEFYSHENACVKCPHDRTLIAKSGSDRVMLPYPHIRSCSGFRLSKGVQYEHMHGPQFGSLLVEGSYAVVGRITYKGKVLKHCFMEVHVLTQICPMPKYLVAHCGDQNKTCHFTCRDSKADLHGSPSLTCGEDKKWKGHLPICKVHTWCEHPSPPPHGRVSCKGTTAGSGLAEGSTCRVRCDRGWTSDNHSATTCRRGTWTNELSCTPRNNNVNQIG